MDVATSNGWSLYGIPLFIDNLNSLIDSVEELISKTPDDESLLSHPLIKLYEALHNAMHVEVPQNPDHKNYRLGNTLGDGNGHWRRVKKGLPSRYRMFFAFRSSAPKLIIYAHFNIDSEIRREGDRRHDIYEAFKRRLKSGKVPNTIDDLLALSSSIPN